MLKPQVDEKMLNKGSRFIDYIAKKKKIEFPIKNKIKFN